MTKRPPQSQPKWTDVKAKLTSLDRMGLIGLFRIFMPPTRIIRSSFTPALAWARDVLKPYKETLDRWLWPDPLRNQDVSVAKAKQAISSYRKAVGEPAGLAELMVFFCESAAGFSNDVGYQDEGYFNALVNMFEQAIKIARKLSAGDRDALIVRLDRVRTISHNLGYGVGDDMDSLLANNIGT